MNRGLHSITNKNKNYNQSSLLPINLKQEDQMYYGFASRGASGNAFRKENTLRRYNSNINGGVQIKKITKLPSITGFTTTPFFISNIGDNKVLIHDRGVNNGDFAEFDFTEKRITKRVSSTFSSASIAGGICVNNKVYLSLLNVTIPLPIYDTLNHRLYNIAPSNINGPMIVWQYIPTNERLLLIRSEDTGAAQLGTIDTHTDHFRNILNHTLTGGSSSVVALPDGRIVIVPNVAGDKFIIYDPGKNIYTYSNVISGFNYSRGYYFNGFVHLVTGTEYTDGNNLVSLYNPYTDTIKESVITGLDAKNFDTSLHPNGNVYGVPPNSTSTNTIFEYDPMNITMRAVKGQTIPSMTGATTNMIIAPDGSIFMFQAGGGLWHFEMSGTANSFDKYSIRSFLEF